MTTDIQTISSGKAIVSKNGKTTGRIYTFGGELSAKEIRQSYKDMGLSGRELTTKVNLALSALPKFHGLNGDAVEKLSGRIHIGPDIDYLDSITSKREVISVRAT